MAWTKEQRRAYEREWHKKNKERLSRKNMTAEKAEAQRKYHREYFAKWKAKNPEKVKAYVKKAYDADPQKHRDRKAESYQRNIAKRRKAARDAWHSHDEERWDLRVRSWMYLGAKCCVCGEDNYACLDFHHIDPAKKTKCVGALIGGRYSWERIEAELDNCVLLCRNCHGILHWGEPSKRLPLPDKKKTTPEGSVT